MSSIPVGGHARRFDDGTPGRASAQARLLGTFSLRQWRIGLALHAVLWGSGYAFGPNQWTASPSFDVIKSLSVSLHVWGALAITLGVLLLWPRFVVLAHGLAAVFWFGWAAWLFLALPFATVTAWGGWLHVLVVASIHRHLSGVRGR